MHAWAETHTHRLAHLVSQDIPLDIIMLAMDDVL